MKQKIINFLLSKKEFLIDLVAALLVITVVVILTMCSQPNTVQEPEVKTVKEVILVASDDYIDELELKVKTLEAKVCILEGKVLAAEQQKEEVKEEVKEEPKEEIKNSKTVYANITHYCACKKCNGSYSFKKNGKNYTETASGIILHDGKKGNYCAATFGKLGDIITINGVDYELVDRMGSKSGDKIDIFIADGHEKCLELGRFHADVELKSK